LKGRENLKFFLFSALCIFLCLISLELPLQAVPPTPPATIVLDEKEVKGELKEGRGEINIPVRIRAKEEVKDIELSVSIRQVQENRERSS
jgi:hypothetical protein